MLINCDTHFEPDQITATKEVFKEWLREIALGGLRNKLLEDINIRKDLIIMVDEPGYFENERFEREA